MICIFLLFTRYYAVGEAVVTAKEELAIVQKSLIEVTIIIYYLSLSVC